MAADALVAHLADGRLLAGEVAPWGRRLTKSRAQRWSHVLNWQIDRLYASRRNATSHSRADDRISQGGALSGQRRPGCPPSPGTGAPRCGRAPNRQAIAIPNQPKARQRMALPAKAGGIPAANHQHARSQKPKACGATPANPHPRAPRGGLAVAEFSHALRVGRRHSVSTWATANSADSSNGIE